METGKMPVLRQWLELARFGIVGEQFGGGDFEEPTVQAQRAVHEPVLHAIIAMEIFQREQDVFLCRGILAILGVFDVRILGANDIADG
jgi:hypothetical protein